MPLFCTFYSLKNPKIIQHTGSNTDNNKCCFSTKQHIRMISEWSLTLKTEVMKFSWKFNFAITWINYI